MIGRVTPVSTWPDAGATTCRRTSLLIPVFEPWSRWPGPEVPDADPSEDEDAVEAVATARPGRKLTTAPTEAMAAAARKAARRRMVRRPPVPPKTGGRSFCGSAHRWSGVLDFIVEVPFWVNEGAEANQYMEFTSGRSDVHFSLSASSQLLKFNGGRDPSSFISIGSDSDRCATPICRSGRRCDPLHAPVPRTSRTGLGSERAIDGARPRHDRQVWMHNLTGNAMHLSLGWQSGHAGGGQAARRDRPPEETMSTWADGRCWNPPSQSRSPNEPGACWPPFSEASPAALR